ncbi:hypothetical protein EK904_001124 [Melospiza melodia maxima]|nr:hypothetical protein EK904_001124 [Melospiza melodia maxima]
MNGRSTQSSFWKEGLAISDWTDVLAPSLLCSLSFAQDTQTLYYLGKRISSPVSWAKEVLKKDEAKSKRGFGSYTVATALKPAGTIVPFYHLGPRGVPSGFFTQFPDVPVSSCPAPFLYEQLLRGKKDNNLFESEKTGAIKDLSAKAFHFTVTARTCQSNYSVLLQSQQGSGTQSSCNITAPESLSTCILSRLCWICKNLQESTRKFAKACPPLQGSVFVQYGGHPIQGMPDQTAATFHIKTKVLFLLPLPFPQQRSDSDSCNRCVPAKLLLPAAGVLEHTDSALSGQSHVTGKYRTASSGTPCMQQEHVLTSCPSSLFYPSGTFTPQGSLHYHIQHKAVHTHPCTPFVPGHPILMPTWGVCPVAVQQFPEL